MTVHAMNSHSLVLILHHLRHTTTALGEHAHSYVPSALPTTASSMPTTRQYVRFKGCVHAHDAVPCRQPVGKTHVQCTFLAACTFHTLTPFEIAAQSGRRARKRAAACVRAAPPGPSAAPPPHFLPPARPCLSGPVWRKEQ